MSELAWHLSIFVKILNVKNMFCFLAEKFQKLLKFLFFHNFTVLNYVDNALGYVAFLQVLSQHFMLHRLKQSSHIFQMDYQEVWRVPILLLYIFSINNCTIRKCELSFSKQFIDLLLWDLILVQLFHDYFASKSIW